MSQEITGPQKEPIVECSFLDVGNEEYREGGPSFRSDRWRMIQKSVSHELHSLDVNLVFFWQSMVWWMDLTELLIPYNARKFFYFGFLYILLFDVNKGVNIVSIVVFFTLFSLWLSLRTFIKYLYTKMLITRMVSELTQGSLASRIPLHLVVLWVQGVANSIWEFWRICFFHFGEATFSFIDVCNYRSIIYT